MKYVLYFISIIILVSLSVGLFSHIKFFGAAPNILLLFVIAFALEKDNEDTLVIATLSGIMLDFYSGLVMGSFALSFLLVAVLLQFFLKRFLVNDLTWKAVVVAVIVSTALVSACVLGFNALAAVAGIAPLYLVPQQVASRALPEIAYNILLLYPVYVAANWLKSLVVELTVKRRYVN